MVLAYKMNVGILLLLLLVVGQQPTKTKTEPRNIEVAGYKLHVQERSGKCVLSYDGLRKGDINTKLTPPCEFIRNNSGTAQYFRYKNKRVYGGYFTVVIMIGGPTDTTRSDIFMRDGCGTRLQAFILRPSAVMAKDTVLGDDGKGPTICPSYGLDEKTFGFLAYSK